MLEDYVLRVYIRSMTFGATQNVSVRPRCVNCDQESHGVLVTLKVGRFW